jgi:hypothetical protein
VLLAEGDDLVGRLQELGRARYAGDPRLRAAMRLETLSPITSIASGGGPMKVTPISVIARAKSVFSEKNPYPGCTPSAPERLMTSMIASVLR